jgi:DNA primase
MIEAAELLEKVDIIDYISQFCELEERDGEWWGLSPLKREFTPSFSVNREQQVFYDFSSGCGGNLYTFVQKYHKVSFPKAIKLVANFAGVDGEVTPVHHMAAASIMKQFRPRTTSEKTAEYTILAPDIMTQYKRDLSKLNVWEEEGISLSSMDKYEVRYDKVSDRLVFPVKNADGEIINISGRTLDPLWKEKKLRKYTYFQKLGICDVIYGLHEALPSATERNEIILFEGAKSVMLADTYNFKNTGAVLTSHLNMYQMRILLKLGLRVVFAFDSEVNIRYDKNIKTLKRFIPVEYIYNFNDLLEPKESPVDRGRDVFITLYENRRKLN